MFFDETQKGELTPQGAQTKSNNSFSELKWSPVDTGDFVFHNFEEEPVFIGQFKSHWKEEDGAIVKGLEFREYPSGQRVILSESYKLLDFFVHNQQSDIDYKTGVFRIEYKGKKELSKGGTTLSLFEFQVAYPTAK